MEKLELKHLAPYLPYGLKFIDKVTEITHVLDSENLSGVLDDIEHLNTIKPILRPLSDMDVDGEINTPEYLQGCCYYYVQNRISEHFDVFGLIEKGLAIDINTLYARV